MGTSVAKNTLTDLTVRQTNEGVNAVMRAFSSLRKRICKQFLGDKGNRIDIEESNFFQKDR